MSTPEARLEETARMQHGAFSTEQASLVGVSADQLYRRARDGRLLHAAPRVYVLPGWPDTFRRRVMVGCLQAGPGCFASHDCAGLLRNVDGIASAPVELTLPRRLRAMPAGVKLHYSTDCLRYDWSIVDGIPTATVTRTILDLAATASLEKLERIFECGVRRRETSHLAVQEAVDRLARPGKPGIRRSRELLAIVCRDGKANGSELETRFYQALRARGLPLPDRQRFVLRPDGSFAFSDYEYSFLPEVVYELLGYKWHSSSKSLDDGTRRKNDFNLLGKTVYEFTWNHVVKEIGYVIDTVETTLRAANREYRG